jgi:hypothetical protein
LSYNTLILKEGINNQYLCVLVPARQVTTWTNISGNIYYNNFTHGYVASVEVDGVVLTLDTSSSPAASKYYYDHQAQMLYINVASPSTKFIAVYYEIYVCTQDLHWYRNPLDVASQAVFYDGYVITPPSMRATLSEQLLGYIPSQSTNMVLINSEHVFEKHLYDSSFNKKYIYVYHWLGDLDSANMKLIIKGIMGDIAYDDNKVSFNIVDRIDLFNQEYRNAGVSFYKLSDFPNINPSYVGRPVRYVFGSADELMPVNLSYVTLNPTNTDNRAWSVRDGALTTITQTVKTGSTTTKTYLNSVNGFQVLDCVKIDKSTDEYVEITAVGADYIEHAALISGAALNGDTVIRQTIGYFHILQGDALFKIPYNLFTCSVSNGIVIVTLDSSIESALSMQTLNGSDQCYMRVYGETNWVTKGGPSFGSDSTIYACLTNPAVILFELMKRSGIEESDIDLASFDTLNTNIGTKDIGFSLPGNMASDFPSYKDLIIKIMQSTLTRLFINNNNTWEATIVAPLATEDTSIAEDEIIYNSIGYNISNMDTVSDVIVGYNFNEKTNEYLTQTAHSNTAEYLHGVSKQKTFNTYLLNASDASTLALRLSYIYGDRQGKMKISCRNRFFDNKITDIIKVELTKLLGYDFNADTLRSRKFDLIELTKSLKGVNFTLNDNKGLEDNSGSW